jgi:hypothetical protein
MQSKQRLVGSRMRARGHRCDYHLEARAQDALARPHALGATLLVFKVALKRPTARSGRSTSTPASVTDDRATIEAVMTAGGKVTAMGTSTFVAEADHPGVLSLVAPRGRVIRRPRRCSGSARRMSRCSHRPRTSLSTGG